MAGLGLLVLLLLGGIAAAAAASRPSASAELTEALKKRILDVVAAADPERMKALAKELDAAGLADAAQALRRKAEEIAVTVTTPEGGMSAELAEQYKRLLTEETRPETLEQFAALLENQGHGTAAATLRAKARAIRAESAAGNVLSQIIDVLQGKPPGTTPAPAPPAPAPPAPAPAPPRRTPVTTTPPTAPPAPAPPAPALSRYTIKPGDIPYKLAAQLTGNANRWKELPGVNPGMKVKTVVNRQTGQRTTLLDPWHPGLTINLPVDWRGGAPAPAPAPPAPTPPPTTPPTLPDVPLPPGVPSPVDVVQTILKTIPGAPPVPTAPPPVPPPAVTVPPAPAPTVHRYTLQPGDVPYRVAQRFTGDANRWREIPKVNPGMVVKTVKGVTLLDPWFAGRTINLPADWNVPVTAGYAAA